MLDFVCVLLRAVGFGCNLVESISSLEFVYCVCDQKEKKETVAKKKGQRDSCLMEQPKSNHHRTHLTLPPPSAIRIEWYYRRALCRRHGQPISAGTPQ